MPKFENLSAKELRQHVADAEITIAKEKAENERKSNDAKRAEYQDFMERIFTEEDSLRIKKAEIIAADQRFLDVEVMRFSSEFLDDHGRRINNNAKDWHDSLTGYALSYLDHFNKIDKSLGYHLIARILNYPNGMIGDVGLYISWEE